MSRLSFDPDVLQGIQDNVPGDANVYIAHLLTRWLRRTTPRSTFQSLVDVVGGKVIDNQVLAEQLRRECEDFPSIKGKQHVQVSNSSNVHIYIMYYFRVTYWYCCTCVCVRFPYSAFSHF